MSGHILPDTRRGKAYRAVLGVAGVAALIGFADSGRAILWLLMGTVGGATPPTGAAYGRALLWMAAWGLMGYLAYQGWRSRRAPSAVAVVALTLIIWAVILT